MLKIDLDGKFFLQTEGMATTLYKKRVVQKGPNAGQEQVTFIGCFTRFSQALTRYIDEWLSDATPKDLADIAQQLVDIENTIQRAAKEVDTKLMAYLLTHKDATDDQLD